MQTENSNIGARAEKYNLKAPSRPLLWLETRALLEGASLLPAMPWLLTQPRGDGRQVMLIPGYGFDDTCTVPLRSYLNRLGYRALPWGLGRNRGRPEADADRTVTQLQKTRRAEEPITLVGWSLGGVIARLVAQRAPGTIREIITLGTPVEGGPKYTAVGDRFAAKLGFDLDTFEDRVHRVNAQGIDCAITIVHSPTDGVVGWEASFDRYNQQARHIAIRGSHMGMVINPVTWRLIARTLAHG